MKQVVITHENGVALTSTKTIGIEPEKIVTTKAVGSACEFVYAETLDRRVSPKIYRVANEKSQIDGYVTSTQIDADVYNVVDGTTTAMSITEKFIEQVASATEMINGTATSCVQIKFRPGAWIKDIIYASGSIGDFADAALTTTTTTAAATTTTTTAAATTTTTTAEVTTTTTTAAATTTTTTAAITTTTTTAGA